MASTQLAPDRVGVLVRPNAPEAVVPGNAAVIMENRDMSRPRPGPRTQSKVLGRQWEKTMLRWAGIAVLLASVVKVVSSKAASSNVKAMVVDAQVGRAVAESCMARA